MVNERNPDLPSPFPFDDCDVADLPRCAELLTAARDTDLGPERPARPALVIEAQQRVCLHGLRSSIGVLDPNQHLDATVAVEIRADGPTRQHGPGRDDGVSEVVVPHGLARGIETAHAVVGEIDVLRRPKPPAVAHGDGRNQRRHHGNRRDQTDAA